MSILLAYKLNDTVYMGTDTRIIENDFKRKADQPSMYRIQKLDNGMLLGISCPSNECQVIIGNSDIFTLDKKGKLTRRHIVTDIIPKLMLLAQRENLMITEDEKFPFMKAVIVLAYKDTMYTIWSNFAVVKNEGFVVSGIAWSLATPTLANTKPTDDINQRLVRAMNIASKYSQDVGKPYVLIDSQNLNYTIVKEEK